MVVASGGSKRTRRRTGKRVKSEKAPGGPFKAPIVRAMIAVRYCTVGYLTVVTTTRYVPTTPRYLR